MRTMARLAQGTEFCQQPKWARKWTLRAFRKEHSLQKPSETCVGLLTYRTAANTFVLCKLLHVWAFVMAVLGHKRTWPVLIGWAFSFPGPSQGLSLVWCSQLLEHNPCFSVSPLRHLSWVLQRELAKTSGSCLKQKGQRWEIACCWEGTEGCPVIWSLKRGKKPREWVWWGRPGLNQGKR